MYSREREREREREGKEDLPDTRREICTWLFGFLWISLLMDVNVGRPWGQTSWMALNWSVYSSLPLNIWQMCGQQMPTSGGTLESCASNIAWISCASQNSRQVLLSSQQPQRVKQRRLTFHPAHSKRGSCTVPLNFRCSKPIDWYLYT